MPRIRKDEVRKHLIILIIAIVVGLVALLVPAETANAAVLVIAGDDQVAAQISGEDYQNAVTTERLMIIGMLGLVVLTWLYLRWRPPPDAEPESDSHGPSERK